MALWRAPGGGIHTVYTRYTSGRRACEGTVRYGGHPEGGYVIRTVYTRYIRYEGRGPQCCIRMPPGLTAVLQPSTGCSIVSPSPHVLCTVCIRVHLTEHEREEDGVGLDMLGVWVNYGITYDNTTPPDPARAHTHGYAQTHCRTPAGHCDVRAS